MLDESHPNLAVVMDLYLANCGPDTSCRCLDGGQGQLHLDPDACVLRCRSCGRSVDVFDFVAGAEQIDRDETRRILLEEAEMTPPINPLKPRLVEGPGFYATMIQTYREVAAARVAECDRLVALLTPYGESGALRNARASRLLSRLQVLRLDGGHKQQSDPDLN